MTKRSRKYSPRRRPACGDFCEGLHPVTATACASPKVLESKDTSPDAFTLQACLTLTGTVPAGTTVRLAGRDVNTDPQGRFALECRLEKGTVSLPFDVTAEGPEGSAKQVTVRLGMETEREHFAWDTLSVLTQTS